MKKSLVGILVFVMLFSVAGMVAAQEQHALVVKSAGNPFMERMRDGFEEAIEETDGEMIYRAPSEPTVEAQISAIEQLVTQGVASIAVAANDRSALQPVLQRAMNRGVKVLSLDSAVNPESRQVHVNQANPELVGRVQVEAIAEMIDYEGEIAVLSATSQATNQNLWIEYMEDELEKDEYSDIELVRIAYGDDLRDKSVNETEALLQSYPDLKGIIAPTTVGIASAARVLEDRDLDGEIALTGLGLPSEMADYIESGVCEWMYLWNPIDLGYLGGRTAVALANNEINGEIDDKFEAGRMGEKEVVESLDGEGTEIMLGEPFKFDADNIDEWKDVY